jgi:hypothetical protein
LALFYNMAFLQNSSIGLDAEPIMQKELQAAEKFYRLTQEAYDANKRLYIVYSFAANYYLSVGKDPSEFIQKWEYFHEKTQKASHEARNRGFFVLSILFLNSKISYEILNQRDPTPSYNELIRIFEAAMVFDPDDTTNHYNFVTASRTYASYQVSQGEDPTNVCRYALSNTEKYLGTIPSPLGSLYLPMAIYALNHGQDPSDFIHKGIDDFSKFLDDLEASPYYYLGYFHLVLASHEWSHARKDPMAALRKAQEYFQLELKANPVSKGACRGIAETYLLMAQAKTEKKENPIDIIHQGLDQANKALHFKYALDDSFNISQYKSLLIVGQLLMLQADCCQPLQKDKEQLWAKAQDAYRQAITLYPGGADAYSLLAEWFWRRAQNPSQDSGPRSSFIAQGMEMAEKALSINKTLAQAWVNRGRLVYAAALSQEDSTKRRSLLQEARGFVDQALSIDANLAHELLGLQDSIKKQR